MALAMPLAFATWTALLNNFVVERAAFDGLDIGVLHVVREIPGFLAFLVIYLLLVFHEQRLALIALVTLGLGTAVVAEFPTYYGLMITTLISSIATQALFSLGAMPDPQTGQRYTNLDIARHHIDSLGVLEEKTKGNLTDEEKTTLATTLYELRQSYVQVANASRSPATGGPSQ